MLAALTAGFIMVAVAPVFPLIYDTTEAVRDLATYMILITAAAIPFFAFSYCTYFVIRTGGKVFLTFILDSFVMWTVVVPVALILAHMTDISIWWLFFICQMIEVVKLIPGIIMLKTGTWARVLVGDGESLS